MNQPGSAQRNLKKPDLEKLKDFPGSKEQR